jgi:hypothetical protein
MLARGLILVHRWLGVVLCLCFLLWFPSGIGMMYFPFPSVGIRDHLERAPALDGAAIAVSPAEAAEALGASPDDLRLTSFDGRPAYRFKGGGPPGGGGGPVVYADSGDEQGEVPMSMVRRLAEAWTGLPAGEASIEQVRQVDQWTIQHRLAALSPVWKFSWPGGEQAYVSQASGEVVQYTTRASRLGAYLGPIPHWFYFTPLRRHGPEWSRTVIWSSGVGTIAAILGVAIGLWRYSPSKRYRLGGVPTGIPYSGQKRWHAVLGLVFGVATVTYAFSGMLSMDPFPSRAGGQGGGPRVRPPDIRGALRGRVGPDAFEAKPPRDALAQLGAAAGKELELTSFDGEAFYLARLDDGATRIVPVQGAPREAFDPEAIVSVVTGTAGGEVDTRLLTQYDRYYLDRTRRQPLPVVLAQLTTGERTRYYIDPATATVVHTYSSRNWVGRWLYNGLHSLNFPWLYNYRPLWDVVVITLMLGGTALGVTSLVLAWRVLGRWLARLLRRSPAARPALSEDLT